MIIKEYKFSNNFNASKLKITASSEYHIDYKINPTYFSSFMSTDIKKFLLDLTSNLHVLKVEFLLIL